LGQFYFLEIKVLGRIGQLYAGTVLYNSLLDEYKGFVKIVK